MLAAAIRLADDDSFDDHLPVDLRAKSSVHFTPIAVARRAAQLLAAKPNSNVLDIGAGAGKFCLVAAREISSARFVGVELRKHLVEIAGKLARALQLTNVEFIHGDALDLDWYAYDAFYLYNPFAEQLFDPAFVLDHTLDFDPELFVMYVSGVRQRLAHARIGTRVVTYRGFGAPPPAGYELVTEESIASDKIELWIKSREITA